VPPRYSYWTIIAGGLPTAFRAADRAELEPTFKRLREKHPDAEMKWFARGKLWDSPEAARPSAPSRDGSWRRDRPPREEPRGADWRPGGNHRDPRQKFKDAKKARNQRWRNEKFERKTGGEGRPRYEPGREGTPRERPQGDARARGARPPWRDRPGGPPRSDRPAPQPWRDRPREEARAPRTRPHGDKVTRPPAARGHDRGAGTGKPRWGDRAPGGGSGTRPFAGGERHTRPEKPPRERPHGDPFARAARPPWRDRPGGQRPSDRPKPQPWRDRPREEARAPRTTPHGDKVTGPPAARARDGRQGPAGPRWNDRAPRGAGKRPFDRGERPARPADRREPRRPMPAPRNQGTEEPQAPPRPRGPNREPRPGENPEPTPPPRPSEPAVPPPGPPERGGPGGSRKRR
jgi:hypothetical protein